MAEHDSNLTGARLPVVDGQSVSLRRTPDTAPTSPVAFGDGFYDEEHEGGVPFRWMSLRATLAFEPSPERRALELEVCCEFGDLSQELEVRSGEDGDRLPLVDGWRTISVSVPPGADRLELELNKPYPPAYYPADARTLGIRIRAPRLHADTERHQLRRHQWANAILNTREMIEGKTVLESTPTSLGIDLHGSCNVKPPCVYCEWDASKQEEGGNVDTPFTVETLQDYGPFFDHATEVVNCSIGEPFMMRNLDELLDVFGAQGKTLEMTTNGQILTDRNIQKLLGRDIHLYISLDAATPETYARLRNDTFDRILENVRRLVDAKGGRGLLPKVFLVFMPMRANVHELDAFVKLSADLGVDQMILRPLNDTPGNDLVWERGGYHFDYERELLPFDELVRVSGRAAELARRLGVELHDQMDFGGSLAGSFGGDFATGREEVASTPTEESPPAPEAVETTEPKPSLGFENHPVCAEPWKDLYILRRGIRPCCYGGASIGDMDDYRTAWNSPILQAIRKKLAAGSFHEYCVMSPACPIVRKSEHVNELPARQKARLSLWRGWQRLNDATAGVPRRVVNLLRRG